LVRIQDAVNTYQSTVTRTQQRVTATGNAVLLLIDVGTVSLTLLFIIFATGLVLLMWVCWQFVRTGRFPSLRVLYASNKGAVAPQVTAGNVVSEEPLKKEATTASSEVVEAEKPATSEEASVAEESVDMVTPPEIVEAKESAISEDAPAADGSVEPAKEDTT
jgi:hypothetical protein